MKDLYNIDDWQDITQYQKIGEILMQCGAMNLKHLDIALNIQKLGKEPIGEILVKMHIIAKEQLDAALVLQKQINSKFA